MPKQQAAGLVAGESGMNRRQISPPRKLPKPMKRPITQLSKVFRINLSILGAARAEKTGPYSSCRNSAGRPRRWLRAGWDAAINAKKQKK